MEVVAEVALGQQMVAAPVIVPVAVIMEARQVVEE